MRFNRKLGKIWAKIAKSGVSEGLKHCKHGLKLHLILL